MLPQAVRLAISTVFLVAGFLLLVLFLDPIVTSQTGLIPPSLATEYPPEVIDRLKRGNELMSRGQLNAAQQEFSEALRLEPRCPEAHNNIGLCYLRQGMLDQAADEFRSALKLEPLYLPSLNNLGSVMYRQRHYDEAVVFYQQALSLAHNEDAEIHTNLANVLRDKGDYPAALEHYHESIRLQPDFAPAYNNLGLTLFRMHRYREAAVEVKKAINLRTGYSEAYYNLGLIYKATNSIPQAIASFQDSLKYETNTAYAEDTRKQIRELTTPRSANEHLERGYDLLEKRQWKQAEQEFRQALKASQSDPIAWNNLGLALANQQRYAEAVKAYRKAVGLKPTGFAAAQYNLGQSLRQLGNNVGAEKAFRQAISDSKGSHALAHVGLGIVLKGKGDFKGAVQSYKLAVLQSGDTLPVVHYDLGVVLERMYSSRDAAREFQIYLAQAPNGLNAGRARARLRQLGINAP